MHRVCRAFFIAVWLIAESAQAAPAASQPQATALGGITFPKLTIARSRLDNQLRVVLQEDHSQPTVAVCVSYGVGARDEEPDRQGLALLVELALLQGSSNALSGHNQLLSAPGGVATSSTTSDTTTFCQTLKSGDIELALWLEAERMKTLPLTSESFENRRQIANDRYIDEVESQVYANGRIKLEQLVFQGFWPYEHAVVASTAALKRIPIEAVTAFHRRYYTPNNAVLSIAGDFDGNRVLALVNHYFGDLAPREPQAAFDSGHAQPQQTSERLDVLSDEKSLTPMAFYGWRIPASGSKAHLALELAAEILAGGESSRLYQSLVRGRGSALSTSAWTLGHAGPDMFGLSISIAAASSVDKVQAVLDAELGRLRTAGPSAAELTKAKARALRHALMLLESNQGRASLLGARELLRHDASSLNDDRAAYLAISADDVRHAVAEYLLDQRRSIVEVYPPGWKQDLGGSSLKQPASAHTYKVKTGDSLSAIANEYRTSVGRLVEVNSLDPKKQIIVGQKLSIPAPLEHDDEQDEPPTPAAAPDRTNHTKKKPKK